MFKFARRGLVGFAFVFLCCTSFAQLSQNSGINGSDTWVAVDLTITNNTSIGLPQPLYNPTAIRSASFGLLPVKLPLSLKTERRSRFRPFRACPRAGR